MDTTTIRRIAGRTLGTVGTVAIAGLAVGVTIDASGVDRTSGGYEAPYTGWTGTPIDWDAADVTNSGFRTAGIVLDTTLDCSTGMLGFVLFGASFDFRVVSERAIVVHEPREACERSGFIPGF